MQAQKGLACKVFVSTMFSMAGRPKKDTGERRDSILQIRLTESERDTFDRAAKGKGLDVSSWARMTLLESSLIPPQRRVYSKGQKDRG